MNPNESGWVLDSSALLSLLFQEPGGDSVRFRLANSTMSSVNWSEVVQKSLARGVNGFLLRPRMASIGLTIVPFSEEDSEEAARLWSLTSQHGLSLADRACLSLARRLNRPVLTADRVWQNLQLGLTIEVIR